jgi:hypothetical protein
MATLVLLLALTLMLGVVAFTGVVKSHYAASGREFSGRRLRIISTPRTHFPFRPLSRRWVPF